MSSTALMLVVPVLLIASFAPGARRTLDVAGAFRHVQALEGASPTVLLDRPDALAVVAGADWGASRAGSGAVLIGPVAHDVQGHRIDAETLLQGLTVAGPASLGDVVPPWSLAWWSANSETVGLATDQLGLQHLYVHAKGDVVLASSSALLVARLTRASPDTAALGTMALVGGLVDDSSPFKGIRKLHPGERLELTRGTTISLRYGTADASLERTGPDAGSSVIARAVGACLDAHDVCDLELSGGLDSRAVLAAIPPARRRAVRALTFGGSESADVRVARRLAEQEGMSHLVVDTAGLDALDPGEALELVERGSRRRDASAMPLAAVVLDWVERQLGATPRLTGQNGEFARGFYYPGELPGRRVTDRRVRALTRWRVLTNDRVDASIFAAGFLEQATQDTTTRIAEVFQGLHVPWLAATDEFYLVCRMQRWLGAAFSASASDHVIVSPFLDPRFLAWCRTLESRDKRSSRAFARSIEALDPRAAATPLDTGLTPAELAHQGAATRLRLGSRTVKKLTDKVHQRLTSRQRPASGSARLASLVLTAWQERGLGSSLEGYDFLDHDVVGAIASGKRHAQPTTIGYLVNLTTIAGTLALAPEPDIATLPRDALS